MSKLKTFIHDEIDYNYTIETKGTKIKDNKIIKGKTVNKSPKKINPIQIKCKKKNIISNAKKKNNSSMIRSINSVKFSNSKEKLNKKEKFMSELNKSSNKKNINKNNKKRISNSLCM